MRLVADQRHRSLIAVLAQRERGARAALAGADDDHAGLGRLGIGQPSSMKTFAGLDLDRIGLEVDADRRALGLAGLVVEAAIVLRAFDDVVHHQAVGEMHLLVRAEAVGREVSVVRGAIDREGAAAVVEADDVFLVDIVGGAGFDPVAIVLLLLP